MRFPWAKDPPRVIRAAKPGLHLVRELSDAWKRLDAKHRAYASLFLGPDDRRHGHAATVWNDLKKYCGDNREGLIVSRASGMSDPYATAFLAGKQAVFKRISRYTYLNLDQESQDGGSSTSD